MQSSTAGTRVRSQAFALIVFLVAWLMLPSSGVRAADDATPFFPLGVWYEGGVGNNRDNVLPESPEDAAKVYEQNFADLESHGINVITIPNSPPPHHKLVLDTAAKHHIKVILELDLDGGVIGDIVRNNKPFDKERLIKELREKLGPVIDHPALLRVQLLDEPPGGAFKVYGEVAALMKEIYPKAEPFCCLVGGENSKAFLELTKSNVVAFDFYPYSGGVTEGDVGPLKAFEGVASRYVKDAEASNADSWAVLQCHEITGGALRFPTKPELRCMTHVSLATGNRGVFWFLYQSERFGVSAMNGLVDKQFKPNPLWDEVGELTKEIAPITATLATLHPDQEMKLESKNDAVKVFGLSDGNTRYAYAVNYDCQHASTYELQLDDKSAKSVEPLTPGAATKTMMQRNGKLEWSGELQPGDGVLFKVK